MSAMLAASYVDLSAMQVFIAAALILANGAISFALRLGLERRLLVASLRTVLQLTAIGYILEWIFKLDRWYAVALLLIVMTSIAGVAAVRRTTVRYAGIYRHSLIAVSVSSWLVTFVALTVVVQLERWYTPQYAIPLLGMILGNALNGISIGLDRFGEELRTKRDEVEMRLSLGATRFEAARRPMQEAIRTGMLPIINSMMVVGIVSLPGMMTGQILAGANPLAAVRYQIVIMFLIAAATALATLAAVLLGFGRLFNHRHQFLYERLVKTE